MCLKHSPEWFISQLLVDRGEKGLHECPEGAVASSSAGHTGEVDEVGEGCAPGQVVAFVAQVAQQLQRRAVVELTGSGEVEGVVHQLRPVQGGDSSVLLLRAHCFRQQLPVIGVVVHAVQG